MAMKDASDNKTGDLLGTKTKAQRYRERQLAAGMRQFSFWLTDKEAEQVRQFVESIRGE